MYGFSYFGGGYYAGELSPGQAFLLTPTDTETATDGLIKTYGKFLTDTVTATEAAAKAVSKPLSDSETPTDDPVKNIGKQAADSETATDSLTSKTVGKNPADSETTTDALAKTVTKPLADTETASDLAAKNVTKPLTDTQGSSDAAVLTLGRPLPDSVTPTDQITNKTVGKHISDTVTPTDTAVITTITQRFLTDTITVTDQITVTRGKVLVLADSQGCLADFPVTTPSRNICGTLYDHESLTPGTVIVGATMRLFRTQDDAFCQQTTTDGAGYYEFLRDSADPYTYYVTAQYDAGPQQVHGISDRGLLPEAI